MTQVPVVNVGGVLQAVSYPENYGAWFRGAQDATFCLEGDLVAPDANVQAMPMQPVRLLTSTKVSPTDRFFGFHTGNFPYATLDGVTCGWVRSHDSRLRWHDIETSDGVFNWTRFDDWVQKHSSRGRDLCHVLFGTPTWASARPSESNSYFVPGLAAEPADLAQWDAYCTAVAQRYPQIQYYEVWNEPNIWNAGAQSGFWSGTQTMLAQLTRRASQAIKAVRPTAKIVSPATTGWLAQAGSSGETYFTGMMNASDGATGTMKDWVDIVGVHLYTSGNSTASLPGIITRLKAAMSALGIGAKEIWDTESAPIAPDAIQISDEAEIRHLKRSLVTMLSLGIARQCYYRWDHATMGISDNPVVIAARKEFVDQLLADGIEASSVLWDGRVFWRRRGIIESA